MTLLVRALWHELVPIANQEPASINAPQGADPVLSPAGICRHKAVSRTNSSIGLAQSITDRTEDGHCLSATKNTQGPSDSMPSVVDDNGQAAPGRLLLLSNRLPITIKRSEDGSYSFSMSSGGLVTGLSGLSKTTSFQWYGWPGLEVPENEVDGMKQRLKDEYGAHPVFIDDELADKHYNGFSSTPKNDSLPMAKSGLTLLTRRFHPLAALPLPPW